MRIEITIKAGRHELPYKGDYIEHEYRGKVYRYFYNEELGLINMNLTNPISHDRIRHDLKKKLGINYRLTLK